MEALALLASVTVAVTVVLAILATRRTGLSFTDSDRRLMVIAAESRKPGQPAAPDVRMRRSASTVPFVRSFLDRRGRAKKTSDILERAGMRMTPGQFVLMRWTLGAVALLLTGFLVGWGFFGLLFGIIAGLLCYLLPRLYVAWRTAQRMSRMEVQFVQMLALVASALRSGFSLFQALDSARSRCGPPLSDELSRLLTDIRFGRPVEEAFEDWLERVPSRDLRLIVTAISVQRQSGGNLSEILENLAQTMRERAEVRLQIRSLTAYARFTAKIIAVYPLAVALLLTLMRPDTWGFLWTEQGGWAMLAAAFVMNVLAMAMMRSIARVDY